MGRVGAAALKAEADKAKPEAPKEPSELTVACRFCKAHIWKMPMYPDRKKEGMVYTDLKPASNHKMRQPTFVPLDCPFCGEEVFLRGYHGGFFALTLERGEYPGSRATRSGIRVPSGGFGWFYRHDNLRPIRDRILGVSPPPEP